MNLNEKLVALKNEKGMKTEDLAAASKVPVGTINKLLNGETKDPKGNTLKKLADALGTTVEFLYGNENPTVVNDSGTLDELDMEMVSTFQMLTAEEKRAFLSQMKWTLSKRG